MNAITQRQEPGAVADYGSSLLSVIERASRDPNVDIDKMERLLAMQERVQERVAKQAFTEAKIAMRPELPEVTMKGCIRIVKDGKVTQETPFARFEDIHDAVTPVLSQHGFDLAYRNGLSPDGKVRVTTILSHVDGHAEETVFDLPHDSSGSKNSVQAVGSSTSYGKRYGTLSILNIKVAGEDDDGAAASYKDPSGEPLARTKLDGPHSSKSALKQAVADLRTKVRGVVSTDELNALMREAKPTIDQAERDWTALLNGDPDIPEDVGLKGEVANRRAHLKQQGGSFGRMLASMKECVSVADLHRWRVANETYVDELDGAEARRFQAEWDQLEASLPAKRQQSTLEAG